LSAADFVVAERLMRDYAADVFSRSVFDLGRTDIGYPPFIVLTLSKMTALIGLIVSAQASHMRDWR